MTVKTIDYNGLEYICVKSSLTHVFNQGISPSEVLSRGYCTPPLLLTNQKPGHSTLTFKIKTRRKQTRLAVMSAVQ